MTRRQVLSSLLGLLFTSAASLVVVAPIGCGGGDKTTGEQVAVPPQETQAQNEMENFMKTQGKKKR